MPSFRSTSRAQAVVLSWHAHFKAPGDFLLACILLFAQIFASSLRAQSSPQSPVKVHGGSTTFFTQDKDKWVPLVGAKGTFCTAISANDANQIHVSGFFGNTESFTRRNVKNGRIDVEPYDWRIEFLGHDPSSATVSRVQRQGMALEVSKLDCKNARTGTPSLRLKPLAGATFYKADLPASELYPGSKRFLATSKSCGRESADLCERTAQIRVFTRTKDPKASPLVLNCPDGACTVFVGTITEIDLGPTLSSDAR